MILLHQQRFTVASYHKMADPEHASQGFAAGLIVPVEVTFEHWLNGRASQAEAFLDPGADETVISLRWLSEQTQEVGTKNSLPMANPAGYVDESIEVTIGGQRLNLGDSRRPVWITAQGEYTNAIAEMAGLEDIILGRDFLTQHGLLLLVDGQERTLSLLAPMDRENQQRRARVIEAFDPHQ